MILLHSKPPIKFWMSSYWDRFSKFASKSLLKIKNYDYRFSDRDQIRRTYLQKRPCQPIDHDFPKTQMEKHVILIQHGSQNMLIDWNTTF
jgi:hypothetical protein